MAFLRPCGCVIGGTCRLAGQRATWCTSARAGGAAEIESRVWAAVVPGDHVRAPDGSWWLVVLHDAAGRVQLRGTAGGRAAVVWGKPTPSPWEVARGWVAFDPASRVEVQLARESMGNPWQLTHEQAVAMVAHVLDGRVIE